MGLWEPCGCCLVPAFHPGPAGAPGSVRIKDHPPASPGWQHAVLGAAAEGVGWGGVQRMHPALWPHSDLDGVTRRTAGTAELQASGWEPAGPSGAFS